KPPARSYFAMAYDSESDRVILFGGLGASSGEFNDTWAYDFNTNTWTKMDPVAEAPARGSHAMTYETRSDRVILFGGNSNAGLLNDTWAYDFNTNSWTDRAPSVGPAASYSVGMAYDAQSDRLILFGGCCTSLGLPLNDTWADDFNADTWTHVDP